jgi:tetratricopeptide (TPR) repeat protein
LATLTTVFAGSNIRAAISVAVVLVISVSVTGYLTARYRQAREERGLRHYEVGQALEGAGDMSGAAEEYRKALLFLPDETEYRLALAIALIQLGQLDEAQYYLGDLLGDDPTSGIVNLMLARVAQKQGHTGQAIEYLQRSVYGFWPRQKLNMRHAARWDLVRLLQKQNRRPEMIAELLQLYANSGNNAEEKSKIGFLLLQYDATSDAVPVFRQLTRDNPKNAEAHRGLGMAYFSMGDYLAARHDFQHAVNLNPNDSESATLLSRTSAIIDIDPNLPRLTSADRLRRSRLLLDRVIYNLEQCSKRNGSSEDLKQELVDGRKLLQSRYTDADALALQLQDRAQQLWKDRKAFCGDEPVTEPSVNTVLAGLSR